MNARPTPTPQSTDTDTSSRRKRSRTEKESDIPSTESETNTQTDQSEDPRASKRKRDAVPYTEVDEATRNTSGFFETEDISEEVQRRLRIKEERRRQKESAKPEKRKRESLLSNESVSPGPSKHRKKRARAGNALKRDGEMMSEGETEWESKRQRKSRLGG